MTPLIPPNLNYLVFLEIAIAEAKKNLEDPTKHRKVVRDY